MKLMPGKNRVKVYVKEGYYHIYNRGVAKQDIFNDKRDYLVFLKFLKEALTEQKKPGTRTVSVQGRSFNVSVRLTKNFKSEITLHCFCLMPNHFHFLIKQSNQNSMESFMRSVITRYSMYFNKTHNRVGPVFQGRYKAVLIKSESQLTHLTRYIHLNPGEIGISLQQAYSSYSSYLGKKKLSLLETKFIMGFFNNETKQYRDFVEAKTPVDISNDITIDA